MHLSSAGIKRPDLPALTSLRFFAALWVVAFHIREIGLWKGGSDAYNALVKLGYLGVSFFFVLSGFILVYVYTGQRIAKRPFWQARFARIYPAYALSLLVTLPGLLHFLPWMRQLHVTGLVLVAYPLLLEAWFPSILLFWNIVAWTLSAEVFFYLVFPFAIRRLEALTWRGLRLWMIGCWLASLVLTGTYVLLRPDGIAHTTSADMQSFWLGVIKLNPLVRLPEFLLGMGAGAALLYLPKQPRSWPIAAGAALLLLGIVFQNRVPYPMMHSGLMAPAFALLIFGFATQPAWSGFLAAGPLVLLGESSYSLYLLHAMPIGVMAFLLHLDRSPYIREILLGYLAGMCLVSIAVYFWIENPMRRLLRPVPRLSANVVALPVAAQEAARARAS